MTLDLEKLRAETLALLDGTTPGPWHRDFWDILGNSGGTGHVCEVSRPTGDDEQYWNNGEADANARLIAAAPTLAADTLRLLDDNLRLRGALERIACQKRTDELVTAFDVEYADFEDGYNLAVDEARAALAEGGPDDR